MHVICWCTVRDLTWLHSKVHSVSNEICTLLSNHMCSIYIARCAVARSRIVVRRISLAGSDDVISMLCLYVSCCPNYPLFYSSPPIRRLILSKRIQNTWISNFWNLVTLVDQIWIVINKKMMITKPKLSLD